MNMGDLPPTQLYASLAFVLSVATLWLNRLKDDAEARDYMHGRHRIALNVVVCTILTLPIVHVLYVLLVLSSANLWHQIAHATPLVGAMFAIIGWWMRTLMVTPTIEAEDAPP